MSESGKAPEADLSEQAIEAGLKQRPRSSTLLNLKWWAERLRKAKEIKARLDSGSYKVDSKELAQALINHNSGEQPT